jgi:hypothetical protein
VAGIGVVPEPVPGQASNAAEAFVQHWAKSRIDQPQQVMNRHDEAAKQLIAVSAFLQGAYLAVFTFGDLKGQLPMALLGPMFIPLLAVVVCAATVICAVPTDMNVHRALTLLTRAGSSSTYAGEVDSAIKSWCEDIDRIAEKKARWLHRGNISFIFASMVTIGLLFVAAMM